MLKQILEDDDDFTFIKSFFEKVLFIFSILFIIFAPLIKKAIIKFFE